MNDADDQLRALVPDSLFAHPYNGHAWADRAPTQNDGLRTGNARRPKPLSTRARMVLSLEMRGYDKQSIAGHIGISPQRVHQITYSDRYIEAREALLSRMDYEFVAMKPAAFAALRNAINSRDENTALRGSEAWMRAAGFGQYGRGASNPVGAVTAEDVARRLLQLQVSVNVSVEK